MKKGQTLKSPRSLNAAQTEACPSSGLDHETLHLYSRSDRAEAANRGCQGTLGEEVDKRITPTNMIVKERTEAGLYEYLRGAQG